jgi:retron-type reverse transcriptase
MVGRKRRTEYLEFNSYQTTAYLMQRQSVRLRRSSNLHIEVKEVFDFEAAVKKFKHECSSAGNAAGVDGIRLNQIQTSDFCAIARQMVSSIQDGTFVPQRLRKLEIPKPNGKTRTLQLNPAVERMVYKSAAEKLYDKIASRFPPHIHGGLPRRGTHTFFVDLQLAVDRMVDTQELWLVERDIISAFDNVALSAVQDSLIKMNLSPNLVETLIRVTTPEITTKQIEDLHGIPQGNPLSPLLFNATIFQCLRCSDSDVAEEDRLYKFLAYVDNLAYVAPERRTTMQVISEHENLLSKIGLHLNQNQPINLREGHTTEILKDEVGLEEGGKNLYFKISGKRFATLKQEILELYTSSNPYRDQLSKVKGFASAKGHVWATCGSDYCADLVGKLCKETEIQSDKAKQSILEAWEKAGQAFNRLLDEAKVTPHRTR